MPTPAVGMGVLSLRLIDDEADSDEESRCDSFEDRLVFPPRATHAHALPHTVPFPHTGPAQDYRSSTCTKSTAAPAPLVLSRPTPRRPLSLQHPRPLAPEVKWWGGAGRGVPLGLVHSASDPEVRRAPLWASPTGAPLQQVAEEVNERRAAPRLARSDSMVTVPEDLLAPRPSLAGAAAAALVAAALVPGAATLLHTAFRLVFGTLFPAYYSYKAVKTKNVKEYVKWMMYWIVFAFFTCLETLTDIFLSFWFPFYYELKILVVLWLLSPATRGSSILYRKFVHPWLTRREEDIDNCIAQAKQQGYSAVLSLGSKGVNYATTVIMQTAIKGGGGLMSQLRRSYSSGELMADDGDLNRNIKPLPPHLHHNDDAYDDTQHHHHPRQPPPGAYDAEPRARAESDAAYKPRGSSASRVVRSNKTRSADVTDYYQDAQDDANGIQRRRSPRSQDPASRILSADDLTSGYSSGGDLDPDPAPPRRPLDPTWDEDDLPDPPVVPYTRKRSQAVRRTQSLSASTLALHRTGGRRGEGRGSHGVGRGSLGQVSDGVPPPASFSSSGHLPPATQSFRRSRPGEVSAYATLPRTTTKRTTAKKRQV